MAFCVSRSSSPIPRWPFARRDSAQEAKVGLPAVCAGPELLEDELLADEGTAAGRVPGAGRVGDLSSAEYEWMWDLI